MVVAAGPRPSTRTTRATAARVYDFEEEEEEDNIQQFDSGDEFQNDEEEEKKTRKGERKRSGSGGSSGQGKVNKEKSKLFLDDVAAENDNVEEEEDGAEKKNEVWLGKGGGGGRGRGKLVVGRKTKRQEPSNEAAGETEDFRFRTENYEALENKKKANIEERINNTGTPSKSTKWRYFYLLFLSFNHLADFLNPAGTAMDRVRRLWGTGMPAPIPKASTSSSAAVGVAVGRSLQDRDEKTTVGRRPPSPVGPPSREGRRPPSAEDSDDDDDDVSIILEVSSPASARTTTNPATPQGKTTWFPSGVRVVPSPQGGPSSTAAAIDPSQYGTCPMCQG